jgi:hypothetical protein
MKRAKSKTICAFDGCKSKKCLRPGDKRLNSRFCSFHCTKATKDSFLSNLYKKMKRRVRGKDTKRPDLYLGLSILPRDVFSNWAKNHPDFIYLYKRWFSNDFDRKLTPSINRMNSSKGYVLNNIEWVTNSQNCGLSSVVRKAKNRKAIYELLGVNK